MLNVFLHRFVADAECLADFFVRQPVGELTQYFRLTLRERYFHLIRIARNNGARGLRDFGERDNLRVGRSYSGRRDRRPEVVKMTVTLHCSDAELTALIAREKRTRRRQRLRMVRHALDGLTADEIAARVKSSRRRVQTWVARWNQAGLAGLEDQPGRGAKSSLDAEQQVELKRRLDAGPREQDGGCTLRGEDVRRILREELGVHRSLSATYYLLHRLKYSCLVPRPKHRKTDPERQEQFLKKNCPSDSRRFAASGRTSDC